MPSITLDEAADAPKDFIYPFFLLHMGMFGLSGFLITYGAEGNVWFGFFHGGLAIVVYCIFYTVIFGRDKVIRMFVNALIGISYVYAWLGVIVQLFGKTINDFPRYYHIIPGGYFVLYTFLLRHACIDGCKALNKNSGEAIGNTAFILVSTIIFWYPVLTGKVELSRPSIRTFFFL